ncbi:Sodium/calcium exchanger protein-domain-containing protein [Amylocystis lapponica]|nr:Sodium/calcium exchanger protein-domain-containing protein [Amylocystis lapponica]
MLPQSSTTVPLASYHNDNISPSSSGERAYTDQLQAIPLPVMTRTVSSQSSASYASTAELIPHHDSRRGQRTFSQRVSSWYRRSPRAPDSEMNCAGVPDDGKRGARGKTPPLKAWHGWQLILFDSWLNVLILLIPTSWILKLATTDSDTLIFTCCILAMIPLVKLHDLATSVLATRIGGSKTGLLNASMSNIVELVVAIIALKECELRVVQSSLIGSMLSKLLLILGMCFFAGGTRFSQQDYDATATQVHSSLLSISVGAVCLPAAFHFALTYTNNDDAVAAGTTLDEQKQDLLRMSHGVAIVLLFIYASYLLFQFWSHTHLYQDSTKASDKLPVAVSVRSLSQRVRSKTIRSRRSRSHASTGRAMQSPNVSVVEFDHGRKEKVSPLLEVPETSVDDKRGRSPYRYPDSAQLVPPSRTAYLLSPFGASSQVTLGEFGELEPRRAPTVRLVQERERSGGRSSEDSSVSSIASGRRSCSSRSRSGSASEPDTPVSEVMSAYMTEEGDIVHVGMDVEETKNKGLRRNMTVVEARGDRDRGLENEAEEQQSMEPKMSWTLTILLLTVVTVLVTINAEWMVESMDDVSPMISKEWIGLILLPTVSSLAECVTAINTSVRDQLTLSISVAVGSTIQTALFVIPAMVVLGWVLDKPLALLFDPFESVVLYISVHTMGCVVADGKSNWLEGVILVCLYVVIAVTFWFYPGSNFSSNLATDTDMDSDTGIIGPNVRTS